MSGSSRVDIPNGEYEGSLIIRHGCEVEKWLPRQTITILRQSKFTATGFFAANEPNEFEIKCKVEEPCRILNSVYGLTVEPVNLSAGENTLRLSIEQMRDGMILYGSLMLETSDKILRRIYLSGRAKIGATKHQLKSPLKIPAPPSLAPKNCLYSFEIRTSIVRVSFESERLPLGLSIDAVAFCLGSNGKVPRDTDVIFFNNPVHESFGIAPSKNVASSVDIILNKIPAEIQAMVICFAI